MSPRNSSQRPSLLLVGLAILVFAASALVATTNPVAQAALTETWSSASNLSVSSPEADDADVQVSQDGTRATAVWKYWNGSRAVIQSASATVTGNTATWGSTTDISPPTSSGYNSRLALSADGTTAVAVWSTFANTLEVAVGSVSGSTATWSAATEISTAYSSLAASPPAVVLSDDGGLATVAWVESGLSEQVAAVSATISGTAATWGSPELVSAPGGDAASPTIAASADGTAITAAWVRSDGSDDRVQSASATVGAGGDQSWGTVTTLSAAGAGGTAPVVTVSQDGDSAVAVWSRAQQVQSASATVSGAGVQAWGAVTDIASASTDSPTPTIALSSDGRVMAATWIGLTGGFQIVQSATGTNSGNTQEWGAIAELSATGGNALAPQVALSTDGVQATATWSRYGSNNVIQASSAIVDGTQASWEGPADLSGAGDSSSPRLAQSADGSKATVVWRRSNSGLIIQSASATLEVPDIGTQWTAVVDSASNRSLSVATDGAGTWVSGGAFGGRISTDNGATWSSIPNFGSGGYITRVAWCGGSQRFVATTSRFGDGQTAYSSDGTNWTLVDAPAQNFGASFRSITCHGSTAVVVGGASDFDKFGMYSTNGGSSWSASSLSSPSYDDWTAVTYASGVGFVAVGGDTSPNSVVVSSDGNNWTSYSAQDGSWLGVGSSPAGDLVAVGQTGSNQVMTSSDAQSWTARTPSAANKWEAVTSAGGNWVAVSSNGTDQVMTSPSGVSWSAQAAAATNNWNSVAYAAQDSGYLVTGRALAGRQAIGDSTNFMYSDAYQPGPPLQPAGVPGDGEAVISFSAPADRGSAITDYEYSVDGGTWSSAGTATSPVTVAGLSNGDPHTIRVRAVNGVSAGSASSPVSVTSTNRPPPPNDPTEAASVLSWTAPTWASEVTQYVVTYRQQGSSDRWGVYAARSTPWPGVLPTEVSLDATVGDCGSTNSAAGWDFCPLPRGVLVGGTTYQFKVFARTATTLGVYSAPVTYTAPEGGVEPLTVEIPDGWGADPNGAPATDDSPPSADPTPGPIDSRPIAAPDPVVPPGSSAEAPPRTRARPGQVRHLRLRGNRVAWKAPRATTGARYQVARKRADWQQWRPVGTRTWCRIGPRVRAVKIRALDVRGPGPVTVIRRSS